MADPGNFAVIGLGSEAVQNLPPFGISEDAEHFILRRKAVEVDFGIGRNVMVVVVAADELIFVIPMGEIGDGKRTTEIPGRSNDCNVKFPVLNGGSAAGDVSDGADHFVISLVVVVIL